MNDATTSPRRKEAKKILRLVACGAMGHRALHVLAVAGFIHLGMSFAAAAQDGGWSKGGSAPPLPPARPVGLGAAAAPTPALPIANGPPPGVDPMVADFARDMPQVLPAASRARMQECGREWQRMKASGASADKTWLAFARVCLVQGK